VSLHDVAPPFEAEIRFQIDRLRGAGISRYVLKVVPNWKGEYPLSRFPSFVELLKEQAGAGNEIVLHGLEHRPHGPLRGSSWERLRGRILNPDNAEFMSLSAEEAFRATRDGLDMLTAAGLPRPAGFCAPGWLLSKAARPALARAGVRYSVGMFSVDDLTTGRRYFLPATGYMGGSARLEWGVGTLNRLVEATLATPARVLRVYLHPQGGVNDPAMQVILRLIERLVARGDRTPATFADVYRPGRFSPTL
jgi:predicted deacetylase